MENEVKLNFTPKNMYYENDTVYSFSRMLEANNNGFIYSTHPLLRFARKRVIRDKTSFHIIRGFKIKDQISLHILRRF